MDTRTYTVIFNGVAATVQQDLFAFLAAAGKPFELCELHLSQSNRVGDAQEEELTYLIKTGATTAGSGGTAPTPIPTGITSAAAGFTARVNDTTKASAGTIVTKFINNWNIRGEEIKIWPENLRYWCTGGERMTIELAKTPSVSITISGTAVIREFG